MPFHRFMARPAYLPASAYPFTPAAAGDRHREIDTDAGDEINAYGNNNSTAAEDGVFPDIQGRANYFNERISAESSDESAADDQDIQSRFNATVGSQPNTQCKL